MYEEDLKDLHDEAVRNRKKEEETAAAVRNIIFDSINSLLFWSNLFEMLL